MGQDRRDEDMHNADVRTWAPLTQAAEAYGVSVDTIRRRIKRQELDTRREMTPQGFRWLVPLPGTGGSSKSATSALEALGSPRNDVTPVYGPHIIPILDPASWELIVTLQRELEERNTEIGRLHEEINRFHAMNTQQAETLDRALVMLSTAEAGSDEIPSCSSLWKKIREWVSG